MDEDIIADLKQFIATTVSQQLTHHITQLTDDIDEKLDKLETKLTSRIDEVDTKLDTILNAVGERFEENTAKTTARLDDHEVRITKLEPKPV